MKQGELTELLEAGIIDEATATRIHQYYLKRKASQPNRILLIFGILGGLLIGLGIILILAHNWDDFSRTTKTIWAFIPLVVGQAIAAWVIWKERSVVWREGAATFLFFAIGACMALISQIYHLPGELSTFLFSWALLALPLIYLMPSSTVSVLYIGGISWYTMEANMDSGQGITWWYWPLFLSVLPYYIYLLGINREGNFTRLHHLAITTSLAIAILPHFHDGELLIVPALLFLGGIYYQLANYLRPSINVFNVVGSILILIILLILTFEGYWSEWYKNIGQLESTQAIVLTIILFVIATGLFGYQMVRKGWTSIQPLAPVVIAFPILLLIAAYSPDVSRFLVNIFILLFGVRIIQKGVQIDHLGIVNYGVAVIAVLILCRFFDTNIPFVVRGLLFIAVGAGFFAANYYMNQKRQSHV